MANENTGWSARKTLLVLTGLFVPPIAVLWVSGNTEVLKALGVFLLLGVGGCALLLLLATQVRERIGVDWKEFWRQTWRRRNR